MTSKHPCPDESTRPSARNTAGASPTTPPPESSSPIDEWVQGMTQTLSELSTNPDLPPLAVPVITDKARD